MMSPRKSDSEQGAPTGAPLRLCAYIRVSTQAQTEKYGLPVQRAEIRKWAKAHGHKISHWTADEGITGANGVESREGLYEALELLRDHRADGLIALNLDRLARKLTVQEGILGQIWATGAQVFTVEDDEVLEDDPEDPMRTAMRQMRGVFSQLERSMLAKRMRAGRRYKRDQGGYAGDGSPPYGFRAERGELVPVPEEQAVLRRIGELVAAGASLRGIGRTLTAEGFAPRPSPLRRNPEQWAPETLRRIVDRLS